MRPTIVWGSLPSPCPHPHRKRQTWAPWASWTETAGTECVHLPGVEVTVSVAQLLIKAHLASFPSTLLASSQVLGETPHCPHGASSVLGGVSPVRREEQAGRMGQKAPSTTNREECHCEGAELRQLSRQGGSCGCEQAPGQVALGWMMGIHPPNRTCLRLRFFTSRPGVFARRMSNRQEGARPQLCLKQNVSALFSKSLRRGFAIHLHSVTKAAGSLSFTVTDDSQPTGMAWSPWCLLSSCSSQATSATSASHPGTLGSTTPCALSTFIPLVLMDVCHRWLHALRYLLFFSLYDLSHHRPSPSQGPHPSSACHLY